jgi:CubicO group peptidase (beta-lactamase class C family)
VTSLSALDDRIQRLIDRSVDVGYETAVQVAVFHGGDQVVDAVAGLADPDTGAAAATDTLFFAASTAKGIASIVAHALVERGSLDYSMRLADVWPAFGAHGKIDVTLEHVLLHTAGVPFPPAGVDVPTLCDWNRMCEALAATPPAWKAGVRLGYHAVTFGFLLGETVRRATGRTLSDWLKEIVSEPLGVAPHVHFGVPNVHLARVAQQVELKPAPQPAVGSPMDRALPLAIRPDARYANDRGVLSAEIPSQGVMSATGAAAVYASVLGQFPAHRPIGPERLRRMAEVRLRTFDVVAEIDSAWAFGFAPYRPAADAATPGSCFGMVGMNGSAAYADIDSDVAVAVMRNRFDPTSFSTIEHVDRLVRETYPGSRARADEGATE